jgi:citrate lyase subunit beta/citryl-CoA lyase
MPVNTDLRSLRSLLFLPATSAHLLARATERGADALVVDLEDSIPPERKAEARPMAAAAVQALAARGATVVLRVNGDPALWRQDLAGLPLEHVCTVMLPKVERTEQIDALAAALAALASAAGHPPPPIAALVETPRGVLAIERIASHPALGALGFGSEDYAGALGVPPEPAALTGPAQTVLTGAHAFGLPCWGLPGSIALVDDLEGLERIVRLGRAIGFTGSVCIHPRQVPVVNRGFSPSDEERAWAARVVAADAAARAGGLGAVLLDGRMIDRPIVERARRWLGTAG